MDDSAILYIEQRKEDTEDIINKLCQLNTDNPVDWTGDLNELCNRNIVSLTTISKIQVVPEEIQSLVPSLTKCNPDEDSEQWKYICLNLYYLLLLKDIFKGKSVSEGLSVQQTIQLKNVIRNVVGVGIASNLLPNVPYYIKLSSTTEEENAISILVRYKRLLGTTYGISLCFQCNQLKHLILPSLKWILSAFYQIIYCPLKKPNTTPDENGFVMTEDIFNSLMEDRQTFKRLLKEFSSSMHLTLYIRETMMLVGTLSSQNKTVSAPVWLQKAVYSNLGVIIRSPKGVENVAGALLDAAGLSDSDDSTKSWATLDIIAKMVTSYRKTPDFRENICEQLNNLLELRDHSGKPIKPFERLVSLCTKLLFHQDEALCREVFITRLLKPLICFTNEECNYANNENITESVSQTMRLLHSLMVDRNFNIPVLPLHILTPVVNVIFCIFTTTFDSSGFKELNTDITDLLLKILQELETNLKYSMFDNFLFGISSERFLEVRSDIEFLAENNSLTIKYNEYTSCLRPLNRAEVLKNLLKKDLNTVFFNYLLNCLTNGEKYFVRNATNQYLLQLEDGFVLDDALERKFAVHKLLIELTEQKNFQEQISENSEEVVRCIQALFLKTAESGIHKSFESESEEFQTLFIVATLLDVLLQKASKQTLNQYENMIKPLESISEECGNVELRSLLKRILTKLVGGTKENVTSQDKVTKTLLDKALEEICDPLLPVRGHGLMMLTKLVEKKDTSVLERKQYILNIFQVNLKSDDSYLYLSAISGLAAMADIFPDTVLNVLAEEFIGFSRKETEDGHEVRMKIGEVFVRVTKMLGDMAPKYKAILLNTFLVGTKDEDHLIRASSLSNLGEVCRVLGYKLGTIVTEVLECVHAIIATDKAVEARRAAVTVIRQLFVGLEKETIVFLKDEILPVYRTLKHIYNQDPDDVMRLQAQLALEELNENMKDFIFSNMQLHSEKKFVVLTEK